MKKVFIYAIAILIVGFANAQEAATGGAKIKFEQTEFDFGDIQSGDKVEHTFKFKNTGDAPLVLSNVQTTCGCTAPNWSKEPIAPGASSEILIKFNSTGKKGKQHKVITVLSNDASSPSKVKILANVLPKESKVEKEVEGDDDGDSDSDGDDEEEDED